MINPEQINLAPSQPASGIDQQIYKVLDTQKIPLLQMILNKGSFTSIIIFASTKEKVKELYKALCKIHIQAKAFHSDLEQAEREEILLEFKNRKLNVLIGTDVLSRGIDVEELSHVINYELPNIPETYVHRIGRTGRAGAQGISLSFCDEDEKEYLNDIHKLIKKTIPVVADQPYHMTHIGEARPQPQSRQGGSFKTANNGSARNSKNRWNRSRRPKQGNNQR